jgi:cell wall-associated NlpC family hydrolase
MRKNILLSVLLSLLLLAGCAGKKARRARLEVLITTARSYTGTPYQWGGTTRAGMDCSGLLLNSFRAIDYTMPRTSEAQSKIGKKVGKNKIQAGDLVFFATGNKKRKITHVGMVTEVRGKENVKFIHASSSLGVVESNLKSEYYQKRFRQARRIL